MHGIFSIDPMDYISRLQKAGNAPILLEPRLLNDYGKLNCVSWSFPIHRISEGSHFGHVQATQFDFAGNAQQVERVACFEEEPRQTEDGHENADNFSELS
jgi:hypothetical protein